MPKDERGYAGYHLQTRVIAIGLAWVLPGLLLAVAMMAVSAAVFLRVINAIWGVIALPFAIAVHFMTDRYLEEADNRIYPWFIGRNAEWEVRNALSEHLDDRFYLLNDVELPHHGGNIDHVVVGPSGVHVIETKGDVGDVDAKGNRLRVRRFPKDEYLRICKIRRDALREYLKTTLPGDSRVYPIYAVIVFTRASIVESRGTTNGVCVEDVRGLLRLLDRYGRSRRLDEVHRAEVFHAIAPCVASKGHTVIPRISSNHG